MAKHHVEHHAKEVHHHHYKKGGAAHREEGGLVEDKPKNVHSYTKDAPVEKDAESEKDSFKRGGRTKHRKHGGHVDGEKPHHRLDKKARGGRMGGSHSPLSSASKVEGRPGGRYDGAEGIDKESD